MSRIAMRAAAGVVLASCLATSGCSAMLVKPPRRNGDRLDPAGCTTSRVGPGLDIAFATLAAFGTGLAATRDDSDYGGSDQQRSAMLLGLSTLTVFAISAVHGHKSTGACRALVGYSSTPPGAGG